MTSLVPSNDPTADHRACQWLGNRGISVPGEDYTRAMVVAGRVVAELRDEPRTWAIFCGADIADIEDHLVVPPRIPTRRYLERQIGARRPKSRIPTRELLTLNLTYQGIDKLSAMDSALVGTDDYLGMAFLAP
jgi:hypothetical protein